MVRKTTIGIIILALCAMGGMLGDSAMQAVIGEIISMRFDHRYAEADSIIAELRIAHPYDPAPLFLRGSNLQDWMLNAEDFRRADEMNAYLDSAIDLAKTDTCNIWNHWLIGSAYGYKAIAQAEQGKYIAALRTSSEAMEYYSRAYNHPSTRAEAALGMGGYNYWKSSKLGVLTFLPFVPNRKDEGIAYMNDARANSLFSRDAAIHALVYVFCDVGMIDSAKALRDSIEQKYPSSVLPLWYDLAIAEAEGDLRGYFDAADRLSAVLEELGDEQAANRIYAHHYAATAAASLQDWDFVCFHCTSVLNGRLPSWAVENCRSEIEDLKGLANRAAQEGALCPDFP